MRNFMALCIMVLLRSGEALDIVTMARQRWHRLKQFWKG